MNHLRGLLRMKWFHKTSNKVVLQTNVQTISYYLERNQVRWAGHVFRMPDHRAPKQLLYGELTERKRLTHKPRLRFEDTFIRFEDTFIRFEDTFIRFEDTFIRFEDTFIRFEDTFIRFEDTLVRNLHKQGFDTKTWES